MVNVSVYNQNTATISRKQTPAETDSNKMIQKIQPCIHKNKKILGNKFPFKLETGYYDTVNIN